MGWFWTDSTASATPVAPHPLPKDSSKTPPSACPMHKTSTPSAPPPASSSSPFAAASSGGGCPVKHDKSSSSSSTTTTTSPMAQGCPVKHDNSTFTSTSSSTTSSATSTASTSRSMFEKLNPLNFMPSLPQTQAANQSRALPTERETSSIPRGDVDSNWEYPSPQQMYNAMVRKSGSEGDNAPPIDAVEGMVAIHNFLNEGAWAEIEQWEARFSRGLGFGWRACRRGEDNFPAEYRAAAREPGWSDAPAPKLNRFMGRPGQPTPKARILQALGFVAPSYRCEPPFDRHDWYVQRRGPEGHEEEVRYVIDYYSGPPEPTGEPVFYLDVRPALDGPTAAVERMIRWGGDVWYRASGATVREQQQQQKQQQQQQQQQQ